MILKTQISNLDLNNDNYVDYLRVIETVEGKRTLSCCTNCFR